MHIQHSIVFLSIWFFLQVQQLSRRSPWRTFPSLPPLTLLRQCTSRAEQESWPWHGSAKPLEPPSRSQAFLPMSLGKCSGGPWHTRMTRAMGWDLGSLRSGSGWLQLQTAHQTRTAPQEQERSILVHDMLSQNPKKKCWKWRMFSGTNHDPWNCRRNSPFEELEGVVCDLFWGRPVLAFCSRSDHARLEKDTLKHHIVLS